MSQSSSTKNLGTYTFEEPSVTKTTTYTVKFKVDKSKTVSATVTVNPKTTSASPSPSPTTSPKPSPTPTTTSSPKAEEAKLSKLVVNGSSKTVKSSMSITVEGKTEISIKPTTSTKVSCTVTNSKNGSSTTINSGNTGNIRLDEGTNKLTIKVKDGKSYTLTVYNTKEEEETPPNVIDETENENVEKIGLKSLEIAGFSLSPEFSSENYEYTIVIPEDKNDITKLEITAIALQDNYSIEILGNEELKDGENEISIIVKGRDEKDSVTKSITYKVKVVKQPKTQKIIANIANVPTNAEIIDGLWIVPLPKAILISILTAIILMFGIAYGVIEYKYKDLDDDNRFGKIPYSKIGFEKVDEIDKKEEEEKPKTRKKKTQTSEDSEVDKNKGKHF